MHQQLTRRDADGEADATWPYAPGREPGGYLRWLDGPADYLAAQRARREALGRGRVIDLTNYCPRRCAYCNACYTKRNARYCSIRCARAARRRVEVSA